MNEFEKLRIIIKKLSLESHAIPNRLQDFLMDELVFKKPNFYKKLDAIQYQGSPLGQQLNRIHSHNLRAFESINKCIMTIIRNGTTDSFRARSLERLVGLHSKHNHSSKLNLRELGGILVEVFSEGLEQTIRRKFCKNFWDLPKPK